MKNEGKKKEKKFFFITLTPSQSVWGALFIRVSVVRVSVRVSVRV